MCIYSSSVLVNNPRRCYSAASLDYKYYCNFMGNYDAATDQCAPH